MTFGLLQNESLFTSALMSDRSTDVCTFYYIQHIPICNREGAKNSGGKRQA